jgi:hypothetical protein
MEATIIDIFAIGDFTITSHIIILQLQTMPISALAFAHQFNVCRLTHNMILFLYFIFTFSSKY